MANNRRVLIASASAALLCAWGSFVLAAHPSTDKASQQNTADFDAQIAHLRALRERMARATTPEERQVLMNERMKVMQDMMASMRHRVDTQPTKRKGQATQRATCREMMERDTAMMQEMMEMMMDGQGMGPGMGMGMGMGGGMGSGRGGMMPK